MYGPKVVSVGINLLDTLMLIIFVNLLQLESSGLVHAWNLAHWWIGYVNM